jgi:hypothetical protein
MLILKKNFLTLKALFDLTRIFFNEFKNSEFIEITGLHTTKNSVVCFIFSSVKVGPPDIIGLIVGEKSVY